MYPILFTAQIPGIYAEETQPQKEFSMASRHIHDSLELYFLLEGERYYFVEQDTFYLKEGTAILINSDQMHKTSNVTGNTGHHRFLLQLDVSVLNQYFRFPDCTSLEEFGNNYWGVAEFSPEIWSQILDIIDRLKQEMTSSLPESAEISRLLTMELVFLFMRGRRREALISNSDTPGIYHKVHEIALYLQTHSSDPGSLDEIAAHFYISRPYLTRIFKSVTGFTVVEYLTVCRIRKAKVLLRETAMAITDIADSTGFGNITYFERVFKKMTQLTPLQYRKQAGSE